MEESQPRKSLITLLRNTVQCFLGINNQCLSLLGCNKNSIIEAIQSGFAAIIKEVSKKAKNPVIQPFGKS